MLCGFRGKYLKDTETAAESIILNSAFTNKMAAVNKAASVLNITQQRENEENFDNSIEKKQ